MDSFDQKMSRAKIAQKLQMEVWEVATTHAWVYEHGEHILELLFSALQLSFQKLLKQLLKVAQATFESCKVAQCNFYIFLQFFTNLVK